jgi:hypothetical protein
MQHRGTGTAADNLASLSLSSPTLFDFLPCALPILLRVRLSARISQLFCSCLGGRYARENLEGNWGSSEKQGQLQNPRFELLS